MRPGMEGSTSITDNWEGRYKSMGQPISRLRFLLQTVLAALGLAAAPRTSTSAAVLRRRYMWLTMQGVSMLPALHNGEQLKVDRTAYSHATPQRGDIVIFPPPVTHTGVRFLVKRVVGLPEEEILIRNGHVYIDGRKLSEPYVQNPPSYFYPAERNPADSYFLLGDNRNNSEDSHLLGAVPLRKIGGKVIQTRRR